jgi:hypothetical protein
MHKTNARTAPFRAQSRKAGAREQGKKLLSIIVQ